jgi:hypothetical protein
VHFQGQYVNNLRNGFGICSFHDGGSLHGIYVNGALCDSKARYYYPGNSFSILIFNLRIYLFHYLDGSYLEGKWDDDSMLSAHFFASNPDKTTPKTSW